MPRKHGTRRAVRSLTLVIHHRVRKAKEAAMSERSRGANEGEGNKTADRRFRESSKEFVSSKEGREQIAKAGDISERERREGERAAEEGKSHAKEFDPAEKSGQPAEKSGKGERKSS
jgi:hypothetical protein